ncbi:hypothetical protein HPK20_15690 [Vibrio fluvialis]|nr:hypothetical protein [Vibrio fluvialis]QKE35941.1 hypothetical protein HPK20_15690 [Vibrio fluvialis]
MMAATAAQTIAHNRVDHQQLRSGRRRDSDVRRDVEHASTTATTVTLTLAGDSATAGTTSPTRA